MDWPQVFASSNGVTKIEDNNTENQNTAIVNFNCVNQLMTMPLKVDDPFSISSACAQSNIGSSLQVSTDQVNVSINNRLNSQNEIRESCILPDYLKEDLDIVIVGINPNMASANLGHHYAGPGNHFWTCLSESHLVPGPVDFHEDSKMLAYGIGFTNVCSRATKGASELTRKEMKAGAVVMLEKMKKYKPKIAVFNGKGIYEAYIGHKNFAMGKQPLPLEETNTVVFVMPSSSARCAQLPRTEDKLPFFIALRKLREFVRGERAELDDSEIVFKDYTEFRVTQPDPKSLRKAERRRKRKAEAAAVAAALEGANGGMVSEGMGNGFNAHDSEITGDCTSSNVSSKKKKTSNSALDVANIQHQQQQRQFKVDPSNMMSTNLTPEMHAQLQQQQNQALFAMQQSQQQNPFQHHQQMMMMSGGQLMTAPMVSMSMPGLNGLSMTAGGQAAGCYAPFQFHGGHQFIMGQAAQGAAQPAGSLLSWSQQQPWGTAMSPYHQAVQQQTPNAAANVTTQQLVAAQSQGHQLAQHQQQQLMFASTGGQTGGHALAQPGAAYSQHVYLAPAAGSAPGAAASYHLLPVGCPTPGFAGMFVSEQPQQTQQTVNAGQPHQLSVAQSASPYAVANQQPIHFQQQQQPHQSQPQAPITTTANGVAQLQFAAPPQHLPQMTADSATASGTPQFITLATGQPLKVMTVGPGRHLIQAAGMPQFMPSMGMAMATPQQQQTTMTAAMQQKLASQQQQQRRLSASFFPIGSGAVTSAGIPLVQTASGGDDGGQSGSAVPNTAADEKLVYTAL